jgi:hypothetical protein
VAALNKWQGNPARRTIPQCKQKLRDLKKKYHKICGTGTVDFFSTGQGGVEDKASNKLLMQELEALFQHRGEGTPILSDPVEEAEKCSTESAPVMQEEFYSTTACHSQRRLSPIILSPPIPPALYGRLELSDINQSKGDTKLLLGCILRGLEESHRHYVQSFEERLEYYESLANLFTNHPILE